VEFIFENINLPFDDANNDGYVAFKIKTKPTLVLGNTFTNSASIYFDYNFPIVTDPAVTTVALLNTNDFDFGTYFTLYPNPAKDVLNFEVKNEIGVKSVSVYNTLGQIVMAITNVDNLKSIDVSSLTSGSYFVKVYTDKGSSSSKFIKQ
ncbi:T9SS type A sorting domain-containing protein, partial [Flavobacterium sp.]|uniref:T9SS type A sorting domain-containing protein n=1 Tax=Flavobacterium sp. TaxID=239 RepID=UPI0022C57373